MNPTPALHGSAGAPISIEKFLAYSSSNSSQGIRFAMITHRLSCDNFPSKGSSKFSGGVGLEEAFRYISLILVQGFSGILPDFLRAEQLSMQLKPLMAKGFLFLQQTLFKGQLRECDRSTFRQEDA
jgi:hypothetical protein